MFAEYTLVELIWIGLAILMLSMSKGGFPVGSIALPLLILVWPDQATSARSAVAFMLPVLCAMDVVALLVYRRHVQWRRLIRLWPATLVGVAIGSLLFVSDESALIALSDRALKLCIGILGLCFVLYHAARKWIFAHLTEATQPGWTASSAFGVGAGLTSTLAHAAGPLIQMYLLPQKLPKLQFAGTLAAYFFALNLVKILPFAVLGRIETRNLALGGALLPLVPLGVGLGYLLVRLMKSRHYTGFIYGVLFVTSLILIVKAILA
ncbi:MAG: sulfite exporter TauE/SafE family protein [Lentisphaerae bacterium]|nr:sulfite exporter TauE/SafE family protein [Lentisphaerota bacterium]